MGMTEKFHRNNPWIDIAVHGEGERIFKTILEQVPVGLADKSLIPSISYLDSNGMFHHNPKLERMHDLSEVPLRTLPACLTRFWPHTPIRSGLPCGKPTVAVHINAPTVIGAEPLKIISPFPLDRVLKEAWWFGKHKIPYIFSANANFGILKQDVQIAKCLAEVKKLLVFQKAYQFKMLKILNHTP